MAQLPFSPQQGSSVDLPQLPDPHVSGTPSGMPPGLPPAPQGLPFSPGPAPMGRQQPLQPQPSRQWGQTEGIGNILQSVGAGMMGQTPNWQTMEIAEKKQQMQEAQLRAQESQLRAQYHKQANDMVQNWHGLTAAEQIRMRPLFEPLLKNTLTMSGANVPDHVLSTTLNSRDLASSFNSLLNEPLLAKRKDADLARLMEAKDPDKTAKEIEAEHEKEFSGVVQQYLGPAIAKFGGTPDAPLDSQVFAKMVLEDPELGKILKENPKLQRVFNATVNDPKNTEMLAQLGLKTGKTAQVAQEEAVKQAMAMPNLKLIPETKVAYLLKVSRLSPQDLNTMATQDPNRFNAYLDEAIDTENKTLERRQYITGLAAAEARLRVPEKMATTERKDLTSIEVTGERLLALKGLYKPEYVGPIAGRAGALRESYTGAISEEEAEFRSRVTSFNNQQIKDITGAQMSEPEAARIKSELPNVNLPPVTFEARMKQSLENNIFMRYKKRQIMEDTGVDTSGLEPLPPLPARFKRSPELFKKDKPVTLPPVKRSGDPTVTGRP